MRYSLVCMEICEIHPFSDTFNAEIPETKLNIVSPYPVDSGHPLFFLEKSVVSAEHEDLPHHITDSKDKAGTKLNSACKSKQSCVTPAELDRRSPEHTLSRGFIDLSWHLNRSIFYIYNPIAVFTRESRPSSVGLGNHFPFLSSLYFKPFKPHIWEPVCPTLPREMNQDRSKRLQRFSQVHAENLRLDDLLPRLYSLQICTREERQRLETEGQIRGSIAQARLLLDYLKNKDNRAYDLFVHALESSGQTHLAQHLQHELSPSAVLSAADKQKIQSHFASLVENVNISPVMAILRDENKYFTAQEVSKLDSILNEKKKTDCLLTEVVLKGSYRHLALLKKTLIEVGQRDLAKLLPVDMTIIGFSEEGSPLVPGLNPIMLDVVVSSLHHHDNMRDLLVTKIGDPSQDLRKKLIVTYQLNHLKAEADLINDQAFLLSMVPTNPSTLERIEEDVKSENLAKLLQTYSHIGNLPSWSVKIKQRATDRAVARQPDPRPVSTLEATGGSESEDKLTNAEHSVLNTELSTFISNLNVGRVIPRLSSAGLLSPDSKESLDDIGTDQLKAAWIYDEILIKANSYRNVEAVRGILESIDQEGLAMLLPKRDQSRADLPFRHKGDPPPKPTAQQERRQNLGPDQLPIAKSVIFSMVSGKDQTPYDLWKTLKKYKGQNIFSSPEEYVPSIFMENCVKLLLDFCSDFLGSVYDTYAQLKNEEGLNLLHVCLDKGRLTLLMTLMYMGWWGPLSKEKVPDTSLSEHKGRVARQIAESKRTRKPLDEVNQFNEWENSLSLVMKAARQGDLAKVKQQLRIEGAESHYRDNNNGNALFWAVVSGNSEVLRQLLDFGMDHSMKTKKGETLLHVACTLGQHHLVETLFKECHIEPLAEDQNNKTAFDRCAENGDIDTLIALMKCQLTPPNSFPVVTAFGGRKPCLEYCLEQLKMAVDCKDVYERTSLHRAVEGGKYDIAKYLIEKGADTTLVTCSLRNVLHIVAESGSLNTFNLLVEELEKRRCLERMISEQDRYNGVDLCFLIRGRDRGRDAWHYVEVQRNKAPVFLKKTKAGNVDVAAFGNVIKSGWGVNPEQDVIDYIEDMFKARRLNKTAAIDQTPLHIAIFKGHMEIIDILLQKGASVNVKDKFGLTPLMLAAAKGFLDVIKNLERKGASFKVVNIDGKSSTDIADENENDDIVHYILGRDYYQMCTNFVQGDLVRLREELSPQRLDDVRAGGQDVRRHLVSTLRDFRIDINQFLVDLGSGPVLEAVDI